MEADPSRQLLDELLCKHLLGCLLKSTSGLWVTGQETCCNQSQSENYQHGKKKDQSRPKLISVSENG